MAPTLPNTFAEAFNEFAAGVDGESSSSSASAVPEASTALEASTTPETSRPSAHQLALYAAVHPDDDHIATADASAADTEEALLEAREGNAGPHRQAAYERAVAERAGSTSANPSDRFQIIRQKFTASGLRKNSKAPSTFNKHRSNNERFILYLYKNRPDMVHPEFAIAMDGVDATISYSVVYERDNKHKGKKTID